MELHPVGADSGLPRSGLLPSAHVEHVASPASGHGRASPASGVQVLEERELGLSSPDSFPREGDSLWLEVPLAFVSPLPRL